MSDLPHLDTPVSPDDLSMEQLDRLFENIRPPPLDLSTLWPASSLSSALVYVKKVHPALKQSRWLAIIATNQLRNVPCFRTNFFSLSFYARALNRSN